MGNDHVHIWHLVDERKIPDDPDPDSLVRSKVERCSRCGERREYRDSGL
jgi:hypothetical protein